MIVTDAIVKFYQIITNFYFLFNSAIRKMFCECKTKKKLKRCESGYLESAGTNRLTVVLDLDNTLIFATQNKIEKNKNYALINNKFYVYKRPHLDHFLISLSQNCDLILYTAGTREYAEKIVDHIDKNKLISTRYYREDCLMKASSIFKDVSKCGIDEQRTLIIDDSPKCHLSFKSTLLLN
jgi:Dullard-like phosphatase family protein